MKFGGFYELQHPRPWSDGSEHRMIKNALEQVEISDRMGFDYVWATEHHFLEEYAHSSAPEVFLAACSQRTKNVRIGHGIVQRRRSSIIRRAWRTSRNARSDQ